MVRIDPVEMEEYFIDGKGLFIVGLIIMFYWEAPLLGMVMVTTVDANTSLRAKMLYLVLYLKY